MKNKKKLCKIVFNKSKNTYKVMITDHNGVWGLETEYLPFNRNGEPVKSYTDETLLINETIIWKLHDIVNRYEYTFIGVERE